MRQTNQTIYNLAGAVRGPRPCYRDLRPAMDWGALGGSCFVEVALGMFASNI
jgi:hypothetical protein